MIRVITTIILAVAALAGIWTLPLFLFQLLVVVIIGVGLAEYATLVFQEKSARLLMIFLGVLLASLMTWWPTLDAVVGALVGSVFVSFLWGMWHREPLSEATHRVALIVLGLCYLAIPLSYWNWVRELGRGWVMLLLFPACLTDTFGFLVGKTMGKRKLAPSLSPNKTWEGVAGSLLGGGVFGLWVAAKIFFGGVTTDWFSFLFVGISISVVAIFGDLMESLLKRSVGVQGASHLIPGHGGILDRLDALTFVAPLFYFLQKLL